MEESFSDRAASEAVVDLVLIGQLRDVCERRIEVTGASVLEERHKLSGVR